MEELHANCQRHEHTLGEVRALHPPPDFGVHAKTVFDALVAFDVRDPAGSSHKLHRISVRNRMAQRMVENSYWLDARDLVPDVFANAYYLAWVQIRAHAGST